MAILTDQLYLLTGCTIIMLYAAPEPGQPQVLSFTLALIFSCLMICCNMQLTPLNQLSRTSQICCLGLCLLFALLAEPLPQLGTYLPLLAYNLPTLIPAGKFCGLPRRPKFLQLFLFCGMTAFLLSQTLQNRPLWPLLFLNLLAVSLFWKTRKLFQAEQSLHLLRDTSTEYQFLLKQKNKNLIQQQDYEIHVATLKERNRIAREIHDNVGHLLSRSLLQSGALIAINRQEQLKEPLDALKLTLSSAMDSIRQSVHDLHDDSIDLESSIQELLREFSSYQLQFTYDMSAAVPAAVKYCFIAIVKEALSNTARHSNATAISITLREHPVFYQLIVQDNGTADKSGDRFSPGMGIQNMEERAKHLKGHFSVTREHGFRIFVSVPSSPPSKTIGNRR